MARSWIEIDIGAVLHNLSAICRQLQSQTALMAVMKNNAYGHGLVEMARLLAGYGVSHWAVSTLKDGLALRLAGISGEILVLTPVNPAEEIQAAIRHGITLSAASLTDVEQLCQAAEDLSQAVAVHLKIDTGLCRFGFDRQEELRLAAALVQGCPFLHVTGTYTHMADPTDSRFTWQQFRNFLSAAALLRQTGLSPGRLHCASSKVLLRYPDMQLDMVRLGTLLWGQYPAGTSRRVQIHLQIQDSWRCKGQVLAVRELPAGSTLGYGRTWRLRRPSRVAVIGVGWRDGLAAYSHHPREKWPVYIKRLLRQTLCQLGVPYFQPSVRIAGKLCPLRGKLFMEAALAELPPGLEVSPGDEAEIPLLRSLIPPDTPRVYFFSPSHQANRKDVQNGKIS